MELNDSGHLSINFSEESLCTDGLYFDVDDTRICRPTCGEFLARNIMFERVAISIGFILSLLMVAVVLPIQRKTL